MKKLMKKLRYVKPSDILSPFIFILVLPFSLIFKIINRIKKRKLWLICEDGYTARDNGYHFYKYIRENHPKDYCFYVIDKKASDYSKVKEYGNIIQFKSLKHWLYYMSANENISIHKHGNPCQSFFYIIHVILKLYNNRTFLQHGVIYNDLVYAYYKNTRFKNFICGAKQEYEFVNSTFGYPEGHVQYTGLARFDNLYNNQVNEKQIVCMPTWRNWLGGNYETQQHFMTTEYFNAWNSLLNNEELIKFIEKEEIVVYFYPHQHIQKFIGAFKSKSPNIKIVNNAEQDIQTLLKESALLVSDYSSVMTDFAYMHKPIIMFQFDEREFREKHNSKGYFDYKEDGFGPVVIKEQDVIKEIKKIVKNNYQDEDIYANRRDAFFELHDQKNCQRIYAVIKKDGKE